MNRRDFLKGLGLGALYAAAPAILAPPEKKMWFVPSSAPVGSRVERLSERLWCQQIDGSGFVINSLSEAPMSTTAYVEPLAERTFPGLVPRDGETWSNVAGPPVAISRARLLDAEWKPVEVIPTDPADAHLADQLEKFANWRLSEAERAQKRAWLAEQDRLDALWDRAAREGRALPAGWVRARCVIQAMEEERGAVVAFQVTKGNGYA
jgi:hypothetical protein